MSARLLVLFAGLLLWLCPARAAADIIHGSSDEAGVAPDENFEEDCLGDATADDCDLRVALMEGELISVLSRLQNDTDPATQPLFEAALELDNPLVNDMALRYVSRAAEQPQGLLDKAKAFFFGSDAPLAVSAAKVLSSSSEEADRALSTTFAEGRRASDYEPRQPLTPDENNPLLSASISDARIDSMPSFAEAEVFEPAKRLLMYDRLLRSLPPPEPDYPLTAFATDAGVDDVAEFFSQLFGKPLGTFAEANANYQGLLLELAPLQVAAASGDQDAFAKLMALSAQLKQAQDMLTLGALLQLENIHAENDQLWLDGTAQDYFHTPRRAVLVGHDDALDQTVIRYLNAELGPTSSVPDNDNDNNGNAGAAPSDDDPLGAGGANEPAANSDSSGCGCSLPSGSRPSAALAALALLALCARRARR